MRWLATLLLLSLAAGASADWPGQSGWPSAGGFPSGGGGGGGGPTTCLADACIADTDVAG